MFKVVHPFYDLTDMHYYGVGDSFPRDGVTVSDSRIAELSSDRNYLGAKLIEKKVVKKNKKGE